MTARSHGPRHPGDVLRHQYLEPRGITQTELAKELGVPFRTVNRLVQGHCGVSTNMAWKLSRSLSTSPEFWMDLQRDFSLAQRRRQASAGEASRTPAA